MRTHLRDVSRSHAAALAVLLLLSGCSTVSMTTALPHASSASEVADREQLEGAWACRGAVVQLRFREDGIGVLASMEWEEDRFVPEQHELVVTPVDARRFLSVRVYDDGAWLPNHYLAEYGLGEAGELVVWQPDVQTFVEAVDRGDLAGTIERGEHSTDVTLTAAPEHIMAFLSRAERAALFDLSDPMSCRKIE